MRVTVIVLSLAMLLLCLVGCGQETTEAPAVQQPPVESESAPEETPGQGTMATEVDSVSAAIESIAADEDDLDISELDDVEDTLDEIGEI